HMKDSWNQQTPGEMNKMDANFTETLEEFMESALVTWVHLFEDMVGDESQDYMDVNSNSNNALREYLQLTNGVYLNEVMRIIDSNPEVEQIYRNVGDDKILRVQNFSILNRHLRSYYQCETKQTFIQQIQSLNIETQAELALCIQEVTQDPSSVLPLQYGEVCALDGLELQTLLGSLARQIQSLLAQRDTHLERIAELSVQCESVSSPTAPPAGPWHDAPEGLSIQLADSKAKLRRLKQELEDKEDQLIDYKREIQTMEEELKKLQCEGAGGNWATVGRRSRGGRRVHRQREKRKGKSVGLRIGTLNVGTMTGKGRELADMMERRKVDILCVQETRWKGSKARSIGAGFKLFYYGVDSKRNGVGVVLKEEFVRNVLEVKRVSDRVMSLKLEIEGVMLNVVSGYAPQVGCELEEKERFWSELDEVMESIPTGERVVIGADFNGHVGEGNTGDEEVMGKFGVKERNLEGQMVVDFAKRMDMAVVNTYFQKREEHRVTYKSGGRSTQVDYILCRRGNLKEISDCKVVVGESVARQHRMVVCRMTLMVCKKKRSKIEIEKKTKWWKLKKEECCEEFRQKLRQALGGQVLLPDDWETTAEVIRETGRKVLGVSSGRRKEDKETWWWNEEVQDSIQRKRLAKKKWDMDRTEENRQEYKELQRRVKREVSKAKQKAYDELYTRLDTREGEKDLYRLARQRDRDGKDVQQVRVIKDRDGRVLTSEESVQRRWKEYFEELMNEENEREKRVEGVNSVEQKVDKIRKDEVRKALKRMKSGKAVGPDDIPVEVWKCLGEAAVEFLASLFNRVLESERMPEEWRRSVLVPIFKNKGDVQSCSNYRGIKLMSHTMKLWERVVEARLRKVVEICEQQYGFMPRKSTTDAIFALRILMEKYRDGQRELHCVFVDLEKAYDRVPREELWYCMRKSGVAEKYVRVVQDMYERSRTVVRCAVGQTEEFNVEVGLHQGSALSPFLFAIVMDQLSEEVRQESPWTMMFADDIVICSESREQVEENLERWRFALERRGMKVSRSKTEYMCVNEREGSGTVRLQGEEVKKVQEFKYLGSTVQSNGECGKEVKKRVQAGWNGWRKVSGVLCDRKISARIKGKVYRTVVRLAMLYGLETVSLRKRQESELEVAELKMLRFSLGVTRLDRIRNKYIRGTAHVGRLGDKVREARLRWFGHVQRREINPLRVLCLSLCAGGQNRALQGEVRVSRSLRDEVDCLRERANRAEQLQMELKTCTHRLRSMELYRTQLKEQQQYCASLQENKALLEEQLDDTRARCSALRELEKDNLLLRQKLMHMEAERDVERQRVDELLEMNMSLQMDLKNPSHSADVTQRVTHPRVLYSELESDEEFQEPKTPEDHEVDLKPLSVEVNEASSLRLLGAENENAELRRRLERLQAEQEALQTNSPEVTEALQRQTDRLKQLEEEHQNTLREFQNLKNENTSLKKNLEELKKTRLQEKQKERSAGEVEREIPRGECEGKDMGKDEEADKREKRKEEMMRAQREDGEGEEVLLKERKEETTNDIATKERGEAEGEKWTGTGKNKIEIMTPKEESKSDDKIPIQKGKQEEEVRKMEVDVEVDKLHREIHALSTQLQQAVEEADQQANLVQELQSKLGEQTKKSRETEQKLALLEIESQRLRKAAESLTEARKQIEILQCESMHQEEELMCLRSQAELQKMEVALIPQLEGERAALERERETLKATIDSLRASVRKGDQLELTNQTLKAELDRLVRSLDSARRREEELEAELKESGLEIESLGKRRDEAMLEVARLEQEKELCQSELDSQRREQRQKEREMARLRQQLESTASALEHGNQRACSLELQHRRACQELAQLKETCIQLEELKEENQQLNALSAENSTQITSLTQDLTTERLQSQKLSTQVAELKQLIEELEGKLKLATSQLAQLQAEHARVVSEAIASPCNSGTERTEDSKSNRQSPEQSESAEEAHISSEDEITAIESSSEDAKTPEDKKAESAKINSESQYPDNEKLKNLEKENAVLQQEREVLLSQLSKSQAACTQLREQLDTLQRHSISLQESCSKLQELNTKLQVEQASQSSQNALLLAQCREIEVRCATQEAESKLWQKEKEESAVRCESLRRDHERLTALQQRQEAELEELLAKHSQLKSSSRGVEAQYRELEASTLSKFHVHYTVCLYFLRNCHSVFTDVGTHLDSEVPMYANGICFYYVIYAPDFTCIFVPFISRHKELMESKAKLEEAEKEIQTERERMERAVQEQANREKELEWLKMENERQQKEWVQVQSELMAQVSVLRNEMSMAQIERTKLEGELNMLKEQNQQLDLNNVRLNSQYQLLTQLKGNMEEETRHLVEQNQSLAKENRALLERSLESRDQHHNQQREYLDKLNELRREKQKLVEKIMDQYRVLEPGMSAPKQPKKSNWIADRMKKLIKPKGGREGRAQFITIGSTDIQEEPGDPALPSSLTSSALSQEQDPRSAPTSPSILRRVSSQGDTDEPSKVILRTARRKLGSSRHGWGLGRSREGGVSQSFSPGDHRSRPIRRLNTPSSALWEKDHDGSPTPSEEGRGEREKIVRVKRTSLLNTQGVSRVSSGAEDSHSSFDKSLD
ncbi:hypothetical protein QTP86_033175, partial [Hemibagrus guttatus]